MLHRGVSLFAVSIVAGASLGSHLLLRDLWGSSGQRKARNHVTFDRWIRSTSLAISIRHTTTNNYSTSE